MSGVGAHCQLQTATHRCITAEASLRVIPLLPSIDDAAYDTKTLPAAGAGKTGAARLTVSNMYRRELLVL